MKIKKRVFCAAAAFLILFSGLLGYGVEEVRADASSDFVDFIYNDMGATYIHDSLNMDCNNHVVMRQNDSSSVKVLGFYDDVTRVELRMVSASSRPCYSIYLYSDSGVISYYYRIGYYEGDGATSRDEYENVSVGSSGKYSSLEAGSYESYNFSEIDLSELIPFSDVDIYPCEELQTRYGWPAVLKYDIPDPVYNSDLGYLQNLIEKTVYLKDSEGNIDYSTSQRIVGFGSLSTSGLDLSAGEYSIRVYEQGCYYGHDVTTVYKDDYPLIYIGEYAIKNNSISYDPWEARDKTTTETEGWLSDWDLFWGQYERRDNMYYQIVKTNDDGSVEYGGYVKVARLTDNDDGISSTVTPELEPDTGGYSDDTVDSGVGSGTNYDDAEMNADDDLKNNINSSDVSGDIAKDIQSLIAYIGAVPQLLGALLSFLPKEYQTLIFVAFALMLGAIVIKAVRG